MAKVIMIVAQRKQGLVKQQLNIYKYLFILVNEFYSDESIFFWGGGGGGEIKINGKINFRGWGEGEREID